MTHLTAKGEPLTPKQQANAQTLITIGKGLNAPRVALEACIFDAIFESDLGEDNGWNNPSDPASSYGGILGGNQATFQQFGAADSINVTTQEAQSFYQGGRGYQGGGAIALAATVSDPSLLGPQVTAPFDGADPPPYGQYIRQATAPWTGLAFIQKVKAEAVAIVGDAGGLSGGGVFGLGGTGTPANSTQISLWTVGDSANPDQDYFTTINQYSQNAQWYSFSDGETLVIADGYRIMGQEPRAVLIRTDPTILSGNLVYDNTTFTGTHSHVAKTNKVQRRAALTRVISPTQCEVKVICDIDMFRGGEVVYLKLWGIVADGLWLISEADRSVYDPFTTLTLVQAMQPINATSGIALGPQFATGKQALAAGTVMHALVSAATTINNLNVPYEYGGGRKQIGTPDAGIAGGNHVGGFGTVGFDCSGVVCAVLNAAGLWPKSTLGSDEDIIATLLANHTIVPGRGSGSPECTLYDNPGVHIFMTLNGQVFGTSDGGGTPTSGGGSGGAWLSNGPDLQTFKPYHIPQAILGQTAAGVVGSN